MHFVEIRRANPDVYKLTFLYISVYIATILLTIIVIIVTVEILMQSRIVNNFFHTRFRDGQNVEQHQRRNNGRTSHIASGCT